MLVYLRMLADTAISPGSLPQIDTSNTSSNIAVIMGIVFGIAGALALLMISVSGLRYITSAGNPEKTSKAKNGIVYALIGLVIAISAEAIVVFIVNRLPS